MSSSNGIRIFIGYDSDESVAYAVLAYSIARRAQRAVPLIGALSLSKVQHVLTRPRHPLQSNDFAFARFLVPWLCGYEGWALFMDCDMLCRGDIGELWALRDERYAVQVVKHEHAPQHDVKYLGRAQTRYARKNWSSVMLFNCARCRALTPEYVNSASGLELHQFAWLEDGQIGTLPPEWNHLVGYYPWRPDAKLVHFTEGGPYFERYRQTDYAAEWWAEYHDMVYVTQERKPQWA